MTIETRQKDIRAMIRCGEALPLDDAKRLIDDGKRSYHDFEKICASYGVYGVNGLCIEDTTTGQRYADAARSTNVFYFL